MSPFIQDIGDGEFLDDYCIYTSIEKADELISCNIYPNDIKIITALISYYIQ